jgi:hypothetical protein
VSKNSLALLSLVGAIPAAFLLYLLIMSFLSDPGFDNIYGMMKYFAIAALLASAAVVLMPAGILVFAGRHAADEETASSEAGDSEAAATASDSEAEASVADEDLIGGDEFEEESVEVEEDVAASDEELFEAGEDEDFDIEGFEDEKPRR